MRTNLPLSRDQRTPRREHKSLLYLACLLFIPMISASAADFREGNRPRINLLEEFRPVGGSGNNLENPRFDAVPGSPEIAMAPLNFAPGPGDGLVAGPNPRTVSNVIAGGTGAHGQDGQTTDPVASAWVYVFGQFVDHDLDLEETPLTSPAINILVPPGDPVFTPGTSISMTRDSHLVPPAMVDRHGRKGPFRGL